MDRVLAVPAAVLLELDALAVVHLGLVGDVVATLALGALEGHSDPLVGGHRLPLPCPDPVLDRVAVRSLLVPPGPGWAAAGT